MVTLACAAAVPLRTDNMAAANNFFCTLALLGKNRFYGCIALLRRTGQAPAPVPLTSEGPQSLFRQGEPVLALLQLVRRVGAQADSGAVRAFGFEQALPAIAQVHAGRQRQTNGVIALVIGDANLLEADDADRLANGIAAARGGLHGAAFHLQGDALAVALQHLARQAIVAAHEFGGKQGVRRLVHALRRALLFDLAVVEQQDAI